ncbi:universal stress protein [Natronobacterium gregoryi]|uniref:Universal stress family protein n=2 Tax=Natronobacterium gregoryi TaxID=44930 RepID=L0ANV0_NATGS|nr:universal stress protein [Natronobacterium gregoryi]AFZ74902.1 universal stress family protein [Natronobacterium gregoryi SP2]ELY67599.1 UspA domain-containing protein [Natronobacterium gregoryi SP2]PLK18270.1 universal stress protein [Natronobacterium gregoryi SP2]SFJ72757.1 Universal stress protein family protein [Natronobacterium gregoryi]
MALVVVPVRYPLTNRSRKTLERAIEVAEERDAALTVLHVDLYQNGKKVTRIDLKDAVERTAGPIENARYVVRTGFLVEESILDEVAAEGADTVVIGDRSASRFRRVFRRLTNNPDINDFLREHLECEVITVEAGTSSRRSNG